MDKRTAQIIKSELVGYTSGHMALVPVNPSSHSMLCAAVGEESRNNIFFSDKEFGELLVEIGNALLKEDK